MGQYQPPFTIKTISAEGKNIDIMCNKSLRTIPDRRVACVGRFQGKPVFVKVFFHPFKAERHWQRESRGIQMLMENNIPVPDLLFAGRESGGPGRILVQELMPDPVNVMDEWRKNPQHAMKYLNRILGLVVKMHDAGIYQKDMHPDNFLLSGDDTFCIDVAMLDKSVLPLYAEESCSNIALLAAQFPPEEGDLETGLWKKYCEIRKQDWFDDYLPVYRNEIIKSRNTRGEKLLAKLYRNSSGYIYDKNLRKQFCIKSHWKAADTTGKLNNLEKLFSDKDAVFLKQGGSSTVIKINIDGTDLVVKRYNIKNFVHGLRRAFRRTRASRSWAMSHLLQLYGIDTPEPIAFFENRVGPVRRTSYFICEYVAGQNLLEYFSDTDELTDEQKQIADRTISLINKLKKAGIHHGDMKATNLVVRKGRIYLFDLDGMSWFQGASRSAWYHRKDVQRFLRNWRPDSEIYKYFSSRLDNVPA